MKNGFYRLSRGWMDNPVFSSSRSFDRRSAWIWLIENACFKDTKQDVLGKTIKVERWYRYCELSQLVREWSWSEKAVRTFLKRLSNDHMIDMYTGDGKTRIFIVNYDTYQYDGRTFDDKATRYRQQKKEGKKNIKCAAVSKSGNRCKTIIEPGSSYCTVHAKVKQRKDGKKVQCKGRRTNKTRCGMMTSNASGYCYYHD